MLRKTARQHLLLSLISLGKKLHPYCLSHPAIKLGHIVIVHIRQGTAEEQLWLMLLSKML